MKIITTSFETKCVSYFGIDLEVPTFVNYLAADADGTLFGYYFKPDVDLGFFNVYGENVELGVVEFDGDENWEDSLVNLIGLFE
ncbi:hypothetical protein [Photorhabdus tasmaniensis]|uniref:SMI1/KNR4 family protein n=1 Tax=Photorhabdus tasmaniensis TaxID=1004159 RepID=A0ABX0GNA0_9GAMM|nr:hypothetical protein [Photorhabdus tasmaniensis]NHB90331.1 hypothetical protein [Photorhabdus tasmaniensis]